MTRRYTSEIINEIGPEKDIPAPDVGTDGAVMAWIFDTYSMNKGHSVLGVVTGKPLTIGGSLGREEATARGALYCIRDAVAKRDDRLDGMTRRRAGLRQRRLATSRGSCMKRARRVVAISDSTAALHNPKGIDIAAAFAHKREHGTLAGLQGRRGDHERRAAAARCRHARAVRARAGHHRAQRRRREGEDHLRGRKRPGHARRRRDPRGQGRSRSFPTCSRTRAASSSRTSSGCRACRSTSGRRPR